MYLEYLKLSFYLCVCLVRTYEQVSDVGLFLFNDALVLTRRNVHHIPFTLSRRSSHTFLASVALSSLAVREITHTRCEFLPSTRPGLQKINPPVVGNLTFVLKMASSADVRHAFVLEGPRRSWICATEQGEGRERFLSVLRSAMNSALTGHQ